MSIVVINALDGVLIISQARKMNKGHLPLVRGNSNLCNNNIAGEDFRLHAVATGTNDAIALLIGILRGQFNHAISTAGLPDDVRVRRALQQEGVSEGNITVYLARFGQEKLNALMDKTMRSDKGKSRTLCLLAQDRINYCYLMSGKPEPGIYAAQGAAGRP